MPVPAISGDDAAVKEARALLGDLPAAVVKNYRPAEVLSYLPGVRRADAHAVRFGARDMTEVARLLSFVTQYQPNLEP